MNNQTDKNKPVCRTKKLSATQHLVSYVHGGVMVGFAATCPYPEKIGTGNDWTVDIQSIASNPENADLREFFASHELMGILKYDLQDWCRENLAVEEEDNSKTLREEMAEMYLISMDFPTPIASW